MKVKPWASPEEVLDALHESLERRRGDDAFWDDLAGLLAALGRDAVERSKGRHELIDNELLEPVRLHALLEEIRAGLASARAEPLPFRRFVVGLSGPGAALLLLLGGATTVGCYESHRRPVDASLTDATAPDAMVVDAGPRDAGPIDLGVVDSGPACAAVAQVAECALSPELSAQLCACVEALDESWQTALRQLVDRSGCSFLSSQAYCVLNACADPATAGDFDLDVFLDNCSAPLYLGVRFD